MNKNYLNRISALLLSSAVAAASSANMASVVSAADFNEVGPAGEYVYYVYNWNDMGKVEFDPDTDAYSCRFTGFGYAWYSLMRRFDESCNEDSGKITVMYDADISAADNTSVSEDSYYIGVDGYTSSLDTRFYVADGWWGPWNGPESDPVDTVEIDGELYDIYKEPDYGTGIRPVYDKYNFWSVRRNNIAEDNLSVNVKNTVSLSEHMKIWEKYGFEKNALYGAEFFVDGYNCDMLGVKMNSFEVTTESDLLTDEDKTEAAEPPADSSEVPGDVNSDGKTDITDLTELSLILVDNMMMTEAQKTAADVDHDGAVKLNDLAKIRQYLSHIIENF